MSSALPSDEAEEPVWELFHENSKIERFSRPPPNEIVRRRMVELAVSFAYDGYPEFELPPPPPLDEPLGEVMRARQSGRVMRACPLTLSQVSALLEYAYGETRDNAGSDFPRPFRTVPSGGALYPLELYLHSARIAGAPAGLYHYNPTDRKLRLVKRGDLTHRLTRVLVQPELPLNAAGFVFITAMFERTVFKYADRGYRFTLLEAGHVAQNLNLAATALGFGVLNIGGYFDRELDAMLDLDGINRSVVYMQMIGRPDEGDTTADW